MLLSNVTDTDYSDCFTLLRADMSDMFNKSDSKFLHSNLPLVREKKAQWGNIFGDVLLELVDPVPLPVLVLLPQFLFLCKGISNC